MLLEELSGDGPDLVVVLDDYHLAETVTVDSTVEAFMRYRPDRVQLVISTRSDPALGIARLRAAGDLLEIRAEHLRFDPTEVAQFLAALGVVGLSDEEAARLAEGTGGWPAPLRLVALLIQDQEPSAFIDSFAAGTRPVVEYLTTDVLELLEPDVQDFVLKDLDPDPDVRGAVRRRRRPLRVGEAVGRARASEPVHLGRRAGEWYSQHHLFAEAMRLELARTQQELLPTLHLRAASWFEEQGDLESAADHAIESRDVALAARLVATQVESMAARGRWATVRGWLAELSWPAALADPELAWVRATSDSFGHDLDGAERWLVTASKGAPDADGALGLPLGYRVEMLRALVGVNDVARAEEAAYRALDDRPGPMWEGGALAGLGQAQYLRGATAEARETLRKAVALIPDAHPNLLVLAIGNLALAEYADGDGAHRGPHAGSGARDDGQPTAICHQLPSCTWPSESAPDQRAIREVPWDGSSRRYRSSGEDKRSAWLANAYLLNAVCLSRARRRQPASCAASTRPTPSSTRSPNPGDLARRSRDLRQRASSEIRTWTEFGEQLSDREIAVLELAGQGLTQREIADQLFISYNTVKSPPEDDLPQARSDLTRRCPDPPGRPPSRQRRVPRVDLLPTTSTTDRTLHPGRLASDRGSHVVATRLITRVNTLPGEHRAPAAAPRLTSSTNTPAPPRRCGQQRSSEEQFMTTLSIELRDRRRLLVHALVLLVLHLDLASDRASSPTSSAARTCPAGARRCGRSSSSSCRTSGSSCT